MKKRLFWPLLVCALCACLTAAAEPITGCRITADTQDTVLDFADTKVTSKRIDELTALLDAMPNLTRVDLYESPLTTKDMDLLTARYPQIEFGFTVHVGDHVLRTDATAFSTLHSPGQSAEHRTRDFYALKFCRHLQALDLGHNAITDISFLRELPELKVLILACNQISDISVLAELPQLEYVELFSNRFTDITPLAGLTNLLDLNLSNNEITDLTPLYGMTSLERLRISMDRHITEEQKQEIAQMLPDCAMGWASHPTAEGWREHPRYDVIYRIFHTRVYEPFN